MRLLRLTTSDPPVSMEDTKAHLRIDGNDLDTTLAPLIPAAVGWFENETRHAISPATFLLMLDGFPAENAITLPTSPLSDVSEVRYVYGGTERTLSASAYTVDPSGTMRGRVTLNPGEWWPATDPVPGSVRVEFAAGWGLSVPPILKTGVLMMVGHLLESPQAAIDRTVTEVPLGVRSIVDQFYSPEAV